MHFKHGHGEPVCGYCVSNGNPEEEESVTERVQDHSGQLMKDRCVCAARIVLANVLQIL